MVPRHRRSKLTFCRRAFPVTGPTVWNSLPVNLRRDPAISRLLITLHSHLRRGCLEDTSVLSGLEVFHDNVLYKSTFYLHTYLHTYLLTYMMMATWSADLVYLNKTYHQH